MDLGFLLHLQYVLLLLTLYLTSSTQLDINFTIYENIPINSKIGDLNATIFLLKINSPLLQIQYCDKNTFGIEYFYLNLTEGSIISQTDIDRESVCADLSGTSSDCYITMGVTLNRNLINIYIFILDINDNSPKFQKPESHFKIQESEVLGYQIKLDQAIDLDSAKYGVFHYFIECPIKSHLSFFKLNRTMSSLSLVLVKSLDYESVSKFAFQLVACDRGHPQLCSLQRLIIDVIDLNDEAPQFRLKNYSKVVSEDLPVGSVLLIVHAVDRENGDFGKVFYKLTNDQDLFTSYVSVNLESGVILLKKPLFDVDKLSFTIEAHDSAQHNSKFDWALVTIFIIDINNHKPNISIQSVRKLVHHSTIGTPMYTTDMFENNPENFDISFINVVDKDRDLNGDVKCHIKTNEDYIASTFSLDNRIRLGQHTFQYKLKSNIPIDRETISNPLTVPIFCQDNGKPILETFVDLKINILDQNEYAAIFTKSNFSISVYEETVNISILTFNVVDQDALSFNEFYLNFSTSVAIEKVFWLSSLTPTSGEIRIVNPLDREKIDQINFYIFAVNKAQDQKIFSSSVIVHIDIRDINDNTPQYSGHTTFEIKENNEANIEIGDIKFSDLDIGENARVTLSTLRSTCFGPTDKIKDKTEAFVVTAANILKATKSFDYESIHNCRVVVSFHDEGVPSRSNKVTINVNILDENDNEPEWIYPSNTDNTVNVSQMSLKIGTRLTRVRAVDKDYVSADKLSYELREKSNFISIDPVSGEIFVTSDLEVGTYELYILVSDNGNPSRNASANLTINIYSDNLFHSINNITRAVLTIILIPVFVIVFSSGFFIFIVLLLRRRHHANVNFQFAKSAVVKNRNFSLNTYKSATRNSKDYNDVSPELMMTSLQNPYFYEADLELELQNENGNIPSNIAQLFLKRSMKPDCEVCSSADSGQGASEEEILLYNFKSVKPDKSSSQQPSNYIFPPLMEEDNNAYFYLTTNRPNKHNVAEDHICNCYSEFANPYAESDNNINILSLLQCPAHSQLIPLINSPNNINRDDHICTSLISSDLKR